MKKTLILTLLSLFSFVAMNSYSAEHTVGQKNKAFSVKKLEINKGDTVHFLNEDPFFHNVFSLSDAKFFDLGSYSQSESKSVVFDTSGTVEVECAIHPEMIMTIDVK